MSLLAGNNDRFRLLRGDGTQLASWHSGWKVEAGLQAPGEPVLDEQVHVEREKKLEAI